MKGCPAVWRPPAAPAYVPTVMPGGPGGGGAGGQGPTRAVRGWALASSSPSPRVREGRCGRLGYSPVAWCGRWSPCAAPMKTMLGALRSPVWWACGCWEAALREGSFWLPGSVPPSPTTVGCGDAATSRGCWGLQRLVSPGRVLLRGF